MLLCHIRRISAAVEVRLQSCCLSTAVSVGFKIPALSRRATVFFSPPSFLPHFNCSYVSCFVFSFHHTLYFILFYSSCSSSIISYSDSSSSPLFSPICAFSLSLLSLSPCIISCILTLVAGCSVYESGALELYLHILVHCLRALSTVNQS